MLHPPQLLLGVVLALAIALAAFRARALTWDGAASAWAVGAVVFGIGGWGWALALLTFFGTSSALSRWRRRAKEALGYEKGGRRDAAQVWANGGVATACALLPLLAPAVSRDRAHLLFLAALAAANADTWGTEIGSALGGRPYDLRTGRPASPGTSGAVSLAGTSAALAGAALLGLFAGGWGGWAAVTAAGLAGALVDSLLGATLQAQWRDPDDPGRWTECPQPRPPDRGLPGIGNDAVNLLCTLAAALLAAFLVPLWPC